MASMNANREAKHPTHEPKNRSVHKVRLGRIVATVWANETESGVRHNVTFSRLYRDGEHWKTSDSFGRDDLLLLAKVADRAHTWICEQPERRGEEEIPI